MQKSLYLKLGSHTQNMDYPCNRNTTIVAASPCLEIIYEDLCIAMYRQLSPIYFYLAMHHDIYAI